MIRATTFDAGTVAKPREDADRFPGMDSLRYTEADFEENVGENKLPETNATVRDVGQMQLRPWPGTMPRKAWVDWTPRYETRGNDGLTFELYNVDTNGSSHLAPAGRALFTRQPRPTLDPPSERIQRRLSWREVLGRLGATWLRLDTDNESGDCELAEPLDLNFSRLAGYRFRLVLPDNSLFTPFDLRYPDRYFVTDDHDREIDASHWLDLVDHGTYRIYLRPRRWRYVAIVLVHYIFVSMFELVPSDEFVTRGHYDRPPYFPTRHHILQNSSPIPGYTNYFGEPRAYDAGIDWQWSHSRNAHALRREIIDGQYWTLCVSRLLMGVEDADVTVWRIAPRAGEAVLGIGRVDTATGRESRVWVYQRHDGAPWYPDTVLGQFLIPFYVDTA